MVSLSPGSSLRAESLLSSASSCSSSLREVAARTRDDRRVRLRSPLAVATCAPGRRASPTGRRRHHPPPHTPAAAPAAGGRWSLPPCASRRTRATERNNQTQDEQRQDTSGGRRRTRQGSTSSQPHVWTSDGGRRKQILNFDCASDCWCSLLWNQKAEMDLKASRW